MRHLLVALLLIVAPSHALAQAEAIDGNYYATTMYGERLDVHIRIYESGKVEIISGCNWVTAHISADDGMAIITDVEDSADITRAICINHGDLSSVCVREMATALKRVTDYQSAGDDLLLIDGKGDTVFDTSLRPWDEEPFR